MDIAEILHEIRPKAAWAILGGNYSGLQWFDESQLKPTEQEILDGAAKLGKKEALQIELPSQEEQLSAIFDALDSLSANGLPIGKSASEMIIRLRSLQEKYK